MLRILLGAVLIGIIVVGGIVVYQNRDTWFQVETTKRYYNGCIEKYRGEERLTPSCNITVDEETKYNLNFTGVFVS